MLSNVLSAAAVAVAGLSAFYAWRSNRVNAEKLHDDRQPQLAATFVPADRLLDRDRPAIELENGGPLGYWRIRARIIVGTEPADGEEQPVLLGFYDPKDGATRPAIDIGRLDLGQRVRVEVVPPGHGMDPPPGGLVRLLCTCHAPGEKPWNRPVDCQFPRTPRPGAWVV
jgi:hypothetical protein